jgi:hypothetical protein
MKPETNRRSLTLRAIFLAALALAIAIPAHAQPAAPAKKKGAAPTESQVMAREILMRMAGYLGGAEKYSVSLRTGYDTVQKSGQKIEFNEIRKVTLSRPANLRIEGERSDGAKTLVVFSGKEITLVDGASNVYATEPQPGNIDQSVMHFVGDLGMRLPLAVMLLTRMPAEFEARVKTVDYVEKATVFGKPTHHLAARTDTADFQVWVADGDQPLPLRVVITYKKAAGQPQFWAQFSDWNLAPVVSDATFTAQIPAGAQKIAFAAQLQRASIAARKAPADKGAK